MQKFEKLLMYNSIIEKTTRKVHKKYCCLKMKSSNKGLILYYSNNACESYARYKRGHTRLLYNNTHYIWKKLVS